jgi:hypothetical protein
VLALGGRERRLDDPMGTVPVRCVYPITAVSALAAFDQPVVVHRPVDGWHHRWRTDSGRRVGTVVGLRQASPLATVPASGYLAAAFGLSAADLTDRRA